MVGPPPLRILDMPCCPFRRCSDHPAERQAEEQGKTSHADEDDDKQHGSSPMVRIIARLSTPEPAIPQPSHHNRKSTTVNRAHGLDA
jgi:hypothetical protein